jgi:hypothetical protein
MFPKSENGIDGRRLPTEATFARRGRGFRDATRISSCRVLLLCLPWNSLTIKKGTHYAFASALSSRSRALLSCCDRRSRKKPSQA